MYANMDLIGAIQQAMAQNSGQSGQNNEFWGMSPRPTGFQNASPHANPNLMYQADPLKGNPYAFVQEMPDLYMTNALNPAVNNPQVTYQDYSNQMQEDYGQNPNVNTGQQPQQAATPAAPKTTMDYMKWLDGSIWDTEVKTIGGIKGKLGDVGANWSYGNYDMHSRYAPPKPGEGASQQDWVNYNTANDIWNTKLKSLSDAEDRWLNDGGG